jgi:TusA-related sulfurtransferase
LPAVSNVPRSLLAEGHHVASVEQINETDWRILVKKG